MSNNQIVIDTLTKKRDELLLERERMHFQYQKQIDEIEDALDTLAGKKVWRTENKEFYDDENPSYIKNTEDGI